MSMMNVIRMALLPSVLLAGGCVSMEQTYRTQYSDLGDRLQACVIAGMTKGELAMQVGAPSSKEVIEDGEIWIYEINEQGDTVTTVWAQRDQLNTSTAQYHFRVTLRFNQAGVMVEQKSGGQNGAMASPQNTFLNLDIGPALRRANFQTALILPAECGTSFGMDDPTPMKGGLKFSDINSGSEAYRLGFRTGDLLLFLNGVPMDGVGRYSFTAMILSRTDETPVRFQVKHRGSAELTTIEIPVRSLNPDFGGIGVILSTNQSASSFIFEKVLPGGPADKVGIQPLDTLLAIDGSNVEGLDLTDVVRRMRGNPGSTVEITIQRSGETKTYKIVREIVKSDATKRNKIRASAFKERSPSKSEPAATPFVKASDEPATRLKMLKELKDSGVLTEDEYQGKRKAIIDQL